MQKCNQRNTNFGCWNVYALDFHVFFFVFFFSGGFKREKMLNYPFYIGDYRCVTAADQQL